MELGGAPSASLPSASARANFRSARVSGSGRPRRAGGRKPMSKPIVLLTAVTFLLGVGATAHADGGVTELDALMAASGANPADGDGSQRRVLRRRRPAVEGRRRLARDERRRLLRCRSDPRLRPARRRGASVGARARPRHARRGADADASLRGGDPELPAGDFAGRIERGRGGAGGARDGAPLRRTRARGDRPGAAIHHHLVRGPRSPDRLGLLL